MNLIYRGQPYKIATFTQLSSDSVDQSKIKLIYRGQIYYTTPRSVMASKAVSSDTPTVTLIYRGVTYERTLQSRQYQQSRAINWRYQLDW